MNYTDSVMGTWSFGYDTLNRLTSGSASSLAYANQTQCWTYDSFGNRTASMATPGGICPATISPTVTYNANNHVTFAPNASTGFGYDSAGDVTADGVNKYLYDGEGRVCAVLGAPPISGGPGSLTGYLYDAEGRRVAKGNLSSFSCDLSANGFVATNQYLLGQSGEQVTELALQDVNQGGTSNPGLAMVWLH